MAAATSWKGKKGSSSSPAAAQQKQKQKQQQPARARAGTTTKKRKRKAAALPPLLPPGTAVEVLRNGSWVGGGTVTIRNDRTYMGRLEAAGMTVLMTRGRVRPAAAAPIERRDGGVN